MLIPPTPLKAAGDLANGYGHRLTLHPGQFTQIGSPKESVIDASVRELHCVSYSIRLFGRCLTEPVPGRPLLDLATHGNGEG